MSDPKKRRFPRRHPYHGGKRVRWGSFALSVDHSRKNPLAVGQHPTHQDHQPRFEPVKAGSRRMAHSSILNKPSPRCIGRTRCLRGLV